MKQPWVFHVGTVQTAISEEGVTSNIEKKERKNPDLCGPEPAPLILFPPFVLTFKLFGL